MKAELSAQYVTRLLNYMDRKGLKTVVPRADGSMEEQPMMNLTAGYVQRALSQLPKQGIRKPWMMHQNYPRDIAMLRFGKVNDSVLQFSK